MKPQRIGMVLYLIGLVVMIGDVVYGRTIQAEVAELGIVGIQAKYGDVGGLKLLTFAFGFPLGAGISLLGAALFGGTAETRAGRYGGIALLVVLVALSIWFWGRYRRRVPAAMRPAVDWQGLGYLAFALAAWNLCGFGGMPSFAVYPEKMIALKAVPFAVGQLKAVMALFILGWVFTAVGLRRAARATL